MRGHARAIIAIGDLATGVIATGRISHGLIAIGALSLGGLTMGYISAGGLAVGYYALDSATFGEFVWSGIHRDPQGVKFFSRLRSRRLTPAARSHLNSNRADMLS